MRRALLSVVVAVAVWLAPAMVRAGEPRQHDGGFFLRMALGGGYASTSIEDEGDEVTFKGPSGNFEVAIGAMVKKNLAIHATLGAWAVLDPTAEFDGEETELDDVTLSLSGIGAGVTYYFGDSNVYVTGSAGAGQITLEFEGESEDTDWGLVIEAALGKEWWVGDRWGIGVAAGLGYHSVSPGEGNSNFNGTSFSVRFSATFN
jgi:hypothetical protein